MKQRIKLKTMETKKNEFDITNEIKQPTKLKYKLGWMDKKRGGEKAKRD